MRHAAPARTVVLALSTAVTTLLGAGVVAATSASPVAAAPAATAAAPVTWTDTFEGTTLGSRWQVVNPEPSALAVSGGALRITGQPGDTWQTSNTARNVVMLDVPAGDFTLTADVSAAVARTYQGAGLIAWQDMDNYVRSGLTFVGSLSPSGTAIENDVETAGVFSAVQFTDRPGSTAERLRLQRTGDTITTSYWTGTVWAPAGSTPVGFDTTQVGLYALAATDGTVLPAAFDNVTLEHAEGAEVVPEGAFVLQADGPAPYLVADGDALRLSADQPPASLRLRAEAVEGGVTLLAGDRPVVVDGDRLRLGTTGTTPAVLRIIDAGGGKVLIQAASDDTYAGAGSGGALTLGDEDSAVRFRWSEVDDSLATLDIDGDGAAAQISDTMYGIFYEDINYAADGGLYAELVRNRSFEFNGTDNAAFTGLTAWQVLDRSGSGTTATVVNDAGRLNPMNRHYLRLVAAAAGDGVRNIGFNNGLPVKAGETYDASVWARSTTAQTLTVRVEDNAGSGVLATGTVALDGSDTWRRYPVTLTATATSDAGRLAVLAGAPSTIALDMVSVMPRDTWVGPVNGRSVLRKDLMEKVAAMDPTFLRFPGGCVTNVGTFRTYEESGYADRQRTYQWKETIGPVEERPTNKNFWGYNQTYGIGYLEYFELAEDLGAEPLPVVSVGANGCGSTIPEMKDPAMIQRWVDDTVDLIEFANGDVTTEWGAKRAALGHPEPFGLDMIGLGNEENTTTFEANFPAFRDAIVAKYPEMTIISNSGPDSSGARFDALWKFNREQQVDLVDEHYYRDPSWFLQNHYRYDSYDREGPKVFLGEYASRGNTWANALAEASYMTGLERNADVVRLASYAPLLANESHVQWNPDAIWFDNDQSWESVNWEVQKLFGTHVGDEVVPSTFDGAVNAPRPIDGGIFLSTWSTSAAYDNVRVTDNASGETLFADEFADGSQWSPQAGTWSATDGRYVQSSTSVTDARSIVTGAYAEDWSNYTFEVEATKLAGSEGFLVGFAAGAANDYYWWNVGGWNNTRSVLQRAAGGSAAEVQAVEGKGVTTGQTYRLKVVVDGTTISLYQDGVLQMTHDQGGTSDQLFQVVTRDERTGDLVAKVVNTSTAPVRTQVSVADAGVEPTARATTLAAAPSATNSKANPDAVKPRTRTVAVSESFEYEFPASSVTFLRFGTADAEAPVVEEVSVDGPTAGGWYGDPATVRVQASDNRTVDRIEVSVDGGAWQSLPGARGAVEVSGDGQHLVEVRAVDNNGNVGAVRPVPVGIDAVAPVSEAVVDGDARTAELRASDDRAGVALLEYRLGDGAWTSYDAPVALGAAATTLSHRATDGVGNVEEARTVEVPAAEDTRAGTSTTAVGPRGAVPLGGTVRIDARVTSGSGTPTGSVTVTEGERVLGSAALEGGRAEVRVPSTSLGVGAHALTVRYAGDEGHAASTGTVSVRVAKATSTTRVGAPGRATPRSRVKAVVRVGAAVPVSGKVTVLVERGRKDVVRRTVAVSGGRAVVRLPRLRPGKHRVTASYTGSRDVAPSRDRTTVRVAAR